LGRLAVATGWSAVGDVGRWCVVKVFLRRQAGAGRIFTLRSFFL